MRFVLTRSSATMTRIWGRLGAAAGCTGLSHDGAERERLQRELGARVRLGQLAKHLVGVSELRVDHSRLDAALLPFRPAVQLAIRHDKDAEDGHL